MVYGDGDDWRELITDAEIRVLVRAGHINTETCHQALCHADDPLGRAARAECTRIRDLRATICPRSTIGGHACVNYRNDNRCEDCPAKDKHLADDHVQADLVRADVEVRCDEVPCMYLYGEQEDA